MQEEIFYQHFKTFGLRLMEAHDSSPDELELTFYYVQDGIKKTYPVSEHSKLYNASEFSKEDVNDTCSVCTEDAASLVHSEIGFAVHQDCLSELEIMIGGFFEEAPAETVSKMI